MQMRDEIFIRYYEQRFYPRTYTLSRHGIATKQNFKGYRDDTYEFASYWQQLIQSTPELERPCLFPAAHIS